VVHPETVAVDPWVLDYEDFDAEAERSREALCTLGNGYFATRGAAAEAVADEIHYPGTYLAGGYDRLVSEVDGHTVENEDLVNLPNWLPFTVHVSGLSLSGDQVEGLEWLDHQQQLDMREGVLTRVQRFRDAEGRTTQLVEHRLVSMDDPHVAAQQLTVVPEDWSGRLEVRAALDGRVVNAGVGRYHGLAGRHLRPLSSGHEGDRMWLRAKTLSSGLQIAVAARTRVTGRARPDRTEHRDVDWVAQDLSVDVEAGTPVTVEKVVALFSSRDRAISACEEAARARVERSPAFAELHRNHRQAWGQLWHRSRLEVDRSNRRSLTVSTFHLLQTLSPHTTDLDVGVPARGLHGEAYRGHVFWDELFVLPFFNLRLPEVTRGLLLYRWRRLPEARWAARQAGFEGAMYPWQSGSDGREETQAMHLNPRSGRWSTDNSRLQRHVGLAVAHSVWQYYQATGDLEFLRDRGIEMLLEIARFWASAATYDPDTGRYDIRGVMGPDEYHDAYPGSERPGLDNNAYTNVMTVWVLRRALDALALLPGDRRDEVRERLGLDDGEVRGFDDVSRRMRLVFLDGGILSQFEGYDRLEELDWERYRRTYGDIRRLDRILEAENDTPNRYKLSKQADVLMLFYLLPAEELADILTTLGYSFDAGTIPRTIDYYLARTSHGSTLSAVVHAWVLARSGRPASWDFFQEALDSDLHDVQGGTTAEGIHLAAMAGSIDLLQRCFTGIETRADALRFDPRLPPEVGEVGLQLQYRGHRAIQVHCTPDRLRVALPSSDGAPIRLSVRGEEVTVAPGEHWETAL
jgi:trehalose/maltose hydrolase-like predicted phosphorylase